MYDHFEKFLVLKEKYVFIFITIAAWNWGIGVVGPSMIRWTRISTSKEGAAADFYEEGNAISSSNYLSSIPRNPIYHTIHFLLLRPLISFFFFLLSGMDRGKNTALPV